MEAEERDLFTGTLQNASAAVGIPLTDAQIDACAVYTDLLLETNSHTNLTRIVAPAAVAVKHFADSLTVLRVVPGLAKGASVVDVGTGAGFPGLVLKITRPDLRLLLLDSSAKRLDFLREAVEALNLADVTFLHSRAEDGGRHPLHRDRYDLVCARAVAALPTLLEWCGPLARVGGRFVAMKAATADEELAEARGAANLLKLHLLADESLTLPGIPGEDEPPATRRLLVYRKTDPTPPRFPRRSADIKSRPL